MISAEFVLAHIAIILVAVTIGAFIGLLIYTAFDRRTRRGALIMLAALLLAAFVVAVAYARAPR